MHVFWLQGYSASSLHDLLGAMGLSKSSLYQKFGGKKDLFLCCVERYCQGLSEILRSLLDRAGTASEFIRELLLNAALEARGKDFRRGCMLMNTAKEFARDDPQIAKRVTLGFERVRGLLEAAISRGRREGDISSDLADDVLASYLISSLEGLRTIVKAGADEKTVREIVEAVMRVFK